MLRDVNLEIRAGETIAIVGPNGCGKTTLMQLLPRFYDPTAGRVLVEGVDIRNVRLRDLRLRFGLVSQEVLMFNDTVENNIRLRQAGCDAGGDRGGGAEGARPFVHRGEAAGGLPNAGGSRRRIVFQAASGSEFRSPARSSAIPKFCCSTRRQARSILRASS